MALLKETNITSTGKLPSSFTGAQLGTAGLLESLLGKIGGDAGAESELRNATTSLFGREPGITSGFDQDFLAQTLQNLIGAQQPSRDVSRQSVTDATRRAGMLSSGLAGTVQADLEGQFALQDASLGSQLGSTFFQEQLRARIANEEATLKARELGLQGQRDIGEGSPEFQQLNELLRSSTVFKESQSQKQGDNTFADILTLLSTFKDPLSGLLTNVLGGSGGDGGLLGLLGKGISAGGSLIDSIFGGGGSSLSGTAFEDFDGQFGTSFADLEDQQFFNFDSFSNAPGDTAASGAGTADSGGGLLSSISKLLGTGASALGSKLLPGGFSGLLSNIFGGGGSTVLPLAGTNFLTSLPTATGGAGGLLSSISSFAPWLGIAGTFALPIMQAFAPSQSSEEIKALTKSLHSTLAPIFQGLGLPTNNLSGITGGAVKDPPADLKPFLGASFAVGSMLPMNVVRRGEGFGYSVNQSLVNAGATGLQAAQVYRQLMPQDFTRAMGEFTQRSANRITPGVTPWPLQFGDSFSDSEEGADKAATSMVKRFTEGANSIINVFLATNGVDPRVAAQARAGIAAAGERIYKMAYGDFFDFEGPESAYVLARDQAGNNERYDSGGYYNIYNDEGELDSRIGAEDE